jgi:hypothetical protein
MKSFLAGFLSVTLLTACPAAIKDIPPAVDCGERILLDAIQGMTIEQILADAGPACGADLIAIVSKVSTSKDARVMASVAYRQATTLRVTLQMSDAGK